MHHKAKELPYKRVEHIGDATLYFGDCLDILPTLDKVDAVITDPPYSERTHVGHDASANGHLGIGKDSANRSTLNYNEIDLETVEYLSKQFTELSNGWIVWMCDHHLANDIQKHLENNGRYVFAPLPYYAPGSRVRLSGDGPSSWTIWIIVARTTKQAKWGTLPGGYVLPKGCKEKMHMGGKPIWLMNELLKDYSKKDRLILDPFMGSGTTGVACMNLGRKFIGIEIEEKYFDIALERIDQAQRQGKLFD